MYQASEALKKAVNSSLIENRVEVEVTLPNGTKKTYTNKDIVPGSLSINAKAVSGSDFELGGVYLTEMQVTLQNSEIDRYAAYGATVKVTVFYKLEDGTEQAVPMGVFIVDEPRRTKSLLQLKCFDNLIKFDVPILEDVTAKAFEALTKLCEVAGVELGMTEAEVNSLINSTYMLLVDVKSVSTAREALSYVAAVLGGFATTDRAGRLVIRQFATTTTDTIGASQRTAGCNVSDYETFFAGCKVRFKVESYFKQWTAIDEAATGIVLDLGDNPVVRLTSQQKQAVVDNIKDYLLTLTYTPADFGIITNPLYDLGDFITLSKVNYTAESVGTIITGYTWTYRAETKLQGVGADARLQGVKTQAEKLIEEIGGQIATKDVVIVTATNRQALRIGDNVETPLFTLSFATMSETEPVFICTVPFTMEVDGNIILRYYLDQIHLAGSDLKKYVLDGAHFVTFASTFKVEANKIYKLTVTMQAETIESDKRKQQAQIDTSNNFLTAIAEQQTTVTDNVVTFPAYQQGEIDTTPAGAGIAVNAIKAILYAQGLAAEIPWDGNITISEIWSGDVDFSASWSVGKIIDELATATYPSRFDGYSDTVPDVEFKEVWVVDTDIKDSVTTEDITL